MMHADAGLELRNRNAQRTAAAVNTRVDMSREGTFEVPRHPS